VKSKSGLDPTQQLRKLLQSGCFPDQSRLPPERTLSAELGISRAVLRKALSVLEAENLIWRHVGGGTFVDAKPKAEKKDPFMIADFTNPAEIMEVRLVIEPKNAAIASLRATPDDIDRMKNALAKSIATTDSVSFEKWDGALHEAIATSTGNSLLTSFFKTLNSLRENKIWGSLKEASLNRQKKQKYHIQHQNLVAAIAERKALEAEKAMRSHLEDVQKNLLGSFLNLFGEEGSPPH
jgi:DNA-binding FadR family transcriptional regulator